MGSLDNSERWGQEPQRSRRLSCDAWNRLHVTGVANRRWMWRPPIMASDDKGDREEHVSVRYGLSSYSQGDLIARWRSGMDRFSALVR